LDSLKPFLDDLSLALVTAISLEHLRELSSENVGLLYVLFQDF
jgi:hypothetical protein